VVVTLRAFSFFSLCALGALFASVSILEANGEEF